ncbi:exo-alpha-sialidase [Candidatus Uhrbacteria bacterium]|nr:exo-alpha-sialidase [Candidatus Uhrbacteria bacterium]
MPSRLLSFSARHSLIALAVFLFLAVGLLAWRVFLSSTPDGTTSTDETVGTAPADETVSVPAVTALRAPEDVAGIDGLIRLGFNNAEQIVDNGNGTDMVWISDDDLMLGARTPQGEVTGARILASGEVALPAIARDGDLVAVGWVQKNQYKNEIRVLVSEDAGETFEEVVLGAGESVSLAVSQGRVAAVWHETSGKTRSRIFASVWSGGAWSSPVQVDRSDASPMWPSVDFRGDELAVAWRDDRQDGRYTIWLRRSHDRGVTWEEEQQITAELSGDPDVCLTKSSVWLAHHGGGKISLVRSDDGGETYAPSQELGRGFFPHLVCSQDAVGVSWEQTTEGPYAADKDAGWAVVSDEGALIGAGAIDDGPSAAATMFLSADARTMEMLWLTVSQEEPLLGTLRHQWFEILL